MAYPHILTASSLIPLLQSCSSKTHLLQLHAHLIATAVLSIPSVSATFLARSVALDIDHSRLFFDRIPHPTILHCNTILRAYSISPTPHKAFLFYAQIPRLGVRPNPFTSTFVLKSCAKMNSTALGKQVHARTLQDGHHSDSVLLTTLMGMYSEGGEAEDAGNVFEEMPVRDTVAWNVLIACYTRNKRTKDALKLFDEMLCSGCGVEPDDVTCLHLLQACAHLGAVEFGERMHRYIEERGYGGGLNLRNSLIAMYSKCGCVEGAYRVFSDTPVRNVVTWSAMISGLAMNGYGRDALEAFGEMRKVGVVPDAQTFTGVLSSCSHSGLVEEGKRYYDMMRLEYGLIPNLHHYGCIVDLLGRAGLLDQAYKFIESEMEVEPDAMIWRTLLGACRLHGRFELGERVMEHLIGLKAEQAGDYVLLLNIYASAGKWEKVANVRKLMKDKGIQTAPGCSTIELNGVVHEFGVDDDSHARRVEIYGMLNEIGQQLKIAGYVPNIASELHDMGNEEKESALTFHSEKIAIAFGILSTPPGTTIRIAKNLRTCEDCHAFAKMVSSVYDRVIVLRDRSRFHHFRQRRCSCNDYW